MKNTRTVYMLQHECFRREAGEPFIACMSEFEGWRHCYKIEIPVSEFEHAEEVVGPNGEKFFIFNK